MVMQHHTWRHFFTFSYLKISKSSYWNETKRRIAKNRLKPLGTYHCSTNWPWKHFFLNMILLQLTSTFSTSKVGFVIKITFLISPEMIQFVFENTNGVRINNVIRQTIPIGYDAISKIIFTQIITNVSSK